MRLIDLSIPMRPHWRWPFEVQWTSAHERGDWFQTTVIRASVHGFTHVDAPLHYVPGGKPIDQTALELWYGPCAVVDVTHRSKGEGVTRDDLERRGGHIKEGDIVLLRTDWDAVYSIDQPEFWSEAPYLTREAAEWLVRRGVKTVGYDFPPDRVLRYGAGHPDRPRRKEEYDTHDVFLPAGVGVIEYVQNLRQIRENRVWLFALPLPIAGADGSPARVVAVEGWLESRGEGS